MNLLRGFALAVGAALFSHGSAENSFFPPHQGDSPWTFEIVSEPSDVFVVNDTDSSTIDRFLFRNQGPIIIDLPIRRFVGPTDADGRLLHASELTQRGIISSAATIHMPAFDVDKNSFPVFDCDGDGIPDQLMNEVGEVYFNDELIGQLEGDNQIWIPQQFPPIPIEKMRFPSAPGEVAINRIRLEIDVANRDILLSSGAEGCRVWATEIDWVGLQFRAAAPVVLVHGINSSGATFAEFQEGLESQLVASDASINLVDLPQPDPLPPGCPDIPYNQSIQHNVEQLQALVPDIAERFGTSSANLVTHSKGGLDSGALLTAVRDEPMVVTVGIMGGQEVLRELEFGSLVTLNTPHRGSVLAKMGVEARQLTWQQAVRNGINVSAAKRLEGAYYCDLTPDRATAFSGTTRFPGSVGTASVATDADRDGDEELSEDERSGFPLSALAANRLYQLVGSVADVTIRVVPRTLVDRIIVTESPTSRFEPNDIVVPVHSADRFRRFEEIDGWHHINVHSTENAEEIATDGQSTTGLLRWRVE